MPDAPVAQFGPPDTTTSQPGAREVESYQFVGSTNVSSAEWDPDKREATVTFLNGRRYLAQEFGDYEWRSAKEAASPGSFFRNLPMVEI